MRGVRIGVGVGAIAGCLLVAGCAHTHASSGAAPAGAPGAHAEAIAAAKADPKKAPLIAQVMSLHGEWESLDNAGKPEGTIRYEVTSGGNVVRETMFPGTAHEMTNMYHMDGDSLVMTHYCAVGNQPQMRAKSGTLPANGKPGEIALKFERVTNKSSDKQPVMGNMTLVLVDANNIREEWKQVDPQGEHGNVVITLRRKKS